MMSQYNPQSTAEENETGETVYLRCSCCELLVEHFCAGIPKANDGKDPKVRKISQKITASTKSRGEPKEETSERPVKRQRKSNPRYDLNFNWKSRGPYKKSKMSQPVASKFRETGSGDPNEDDFQPEASAETVDYDTETESDDDHVRFMINHDRLSYNPKKKKERKTSFQQRQLSDFKSAADYVLQLSDPHCVVADDGENIECTACDRIISHVQLPDKRHRIDNLRSHCNSATHKAKALMTGLPIPNKEQQPEKARINVLRSDSPYLWNQNSTTCVCCDKRIQSKAEWKVHCHSAGHKQRFALVRANPAFSTLSKKRESDLPVITPSQKTKKPRKNKNVTALLEEAGKSTALKQRKKKAVPATKA